MGKRTYGGQTNKVINGSVNRIGLQTVYKEAENSNVEGTKNYKKI